MVAYTTTYNLKKPTVADDEDVWGGYLNDSMDIIDNVLDGTVPVTGIDINSGTLDNVVIGGATANSGTFTVLSATTSLGVTGNITVSGTVDGRDVATDGTKLDGIEANADVTDTANVTAAGALMDSEVTNLAQVKAFSSSDYATAAQGTTADAALARSGGTMTGAITFASGQTFDGRDVSADGSKLDGIESGATADQTASEILTLIKTVDGAGSGLDADTLDGVSSGSFLRSDAADTWSGTLNGTGSISTTSFVESGRGSGGVALTINDGYGNANIAFNHKSGVPEQNGQSARIEVNTDSTTGEGLMNFSLSSAAVTSGQAAGLGVGLSVAHDYIDVPDKIRHTGDTDTYMQFGTNSWSLYVGNSREITVDATGVRLGDTGNGYFQPVSGNYGSVQIDGGAHTGYEGYSIGGRAVFMHDNGSNTGIYNDVNNEWMVQCVHNGTVHLFYNGSSKLDTLSNGVSINGNLYVDNSVAEDWDSLSGTTPTCNVDAAGAFSLTMTGNTTFTFSGADNNWSQGFVLQLTGNGSTVTWPTSVKWAGGTAPDAPASGETDIYVFWTRDGGTNWYGVLSSDAAA